MLIVMEDRETSLGNVTIQTVCSTIHTLLHILLSSTFTFLRLAETKATYKRDLTINPLYCTSANSAHK